MNRVLLAALLALACHAVKEGPLTPLPTLGLRIQVPDGFSLRPLPDGVAIERNVRTHPELRLVRATAAPLSATRRLANGAELASSVERSEGGSGGEEIFLRGQLRFGGATYGVECHDQDEWPGPDVEWCVRLLATLAR